MWKLMPKVLFVLVWQSCLHRCNKLWVHLHISLSIIASNCRVEIYTYICCLRGSCKCWIYSTNWPYLLTFSVFLVNISWWPWFFTIWMLTMVQQIIYFSSVCSRIRPLPFPPCYNPIPSERLYENICINRMILFLDDLPNYRQFTFWIILIMFNLCIFMYSSLIFSCIYAVMFYSTLRLTWLIETIDQIIHCTCVHLE